MTPQQSELRDHFAGLAMQTLLQAYLPEARQGHDLPSAKSYEPVTTAAYAVADAMLHAKQAGHTPPGKPVSGGKR